MGGHVRASHAVREMISLNLLPLRTFWKWLLRKDSQRAFYLTGQKRDQCSAFARALSSLSRVQVSSMRASPSLAKPRTFPTAEKPFGLCILLADGPRCPVRRGPRWGLVGPGGALAQQGCPEKPRAASDSDLGGPRARPSTAQHGPNAARGGPARPGRSSFDAPRPPRASNSPPAEPKVLSKKRGRNVKGRPSGAATPAAAQEALITGRGGTMLFRSDGDGQGDRKQERASFRGLG